MADTVENQTLEVLKKIQRTLSDHSGHFAKIQERFDHVDDRFDSVDAALGGTALMMQDAYARISTLEDRVEALENSKSD